MNIELWPGPMEGLCQPRFVAAVNNLFLVERWMTPFFRVTDHVPRRRALEEFLAPFLSGGVPVTLQLLGSNPETLAHTAELSGKLNIAGINLNFGCPSRRVTGHAAGGGTLRDPGLLMKIVTRVKTALPDRELSIKMRTGYADPHEMETLLPAVAASGAVTRIFLHWRTVTEAYRDIDGEREKRFCRAVRLVGDIPLILNGDINTPGDATALLTATGAAGVMSARGWLRDPWLFVRINGGAAPTPEAAGEQFFSELRRTAPPRGVLLESARMIWGSASPQFRSLLAELN